MLNEYEFRIVLLGAPGVGKGSQAERLSESLKIPHISTGVIMRKAISDGTALGKEMKKYIDDGVLVPDSLVISLVKERLGQPDCCCGFLLDGFPRTIEQAEALDKMLGEIGAPLSHVVDLSVPEEVLYERMKTRAASGAGRSDDTVEVFSRRLEVYKLQTAPLKDYYASKGMLKELSGLGAIEEVGKRLLEAIV